MENIHFYHNFFQAILTERPPAVVLDTCLIPMSSLNLIYLTEELLKNHRQGK